MNPRPLSPAAARHVMAMNRRQFLGRTGTGVGLAALATLLGEEGLLADDALPAGLDIPAGDAVSGGLPGLPHFAPKAKRVIYLFQSGAPSHVDLFDYKPGLVEHRGSPLPESIHMGQRLTTMTEGQPRDVLSTITNFRQYGESGRWLSEWLPHTGNIADDLCFIKSMHTEAINHAPATTLLLTGFQQPGRPSMGAWLSYGLGSANDDLPSFVSMTSRDRENTCGQLFFEYYWGSGFLPSKYQGVQFRGSGDPVLYLSNPAGVSGELRRELLDDVNELNQMRLADVGDPEIATRIAQYEMAYRMQTSVPELTDISDEPEHVLARYGDDVHRSGSFARNCLTARRLVERGVRFVQLMHAGWDQHQNLYSQLEVQCRDTDQPSAALVQDLKDRGLLDETLVIWGGEFGRTVFSQGDVSQTEGIGRDHHGNAYTIWMAGGGIKPGILHGETDDFCYNVTEDPVHVHDLQATILHLLGIDHERLTYKFQGRHFPPDRCARPRGE